MARDFVFDRLRRDLVAGAKNNQILDPPNNAPGASRIQFALISSVKPSIAQNLRGLLRTVPVSGKNIGSANYDLIIFGEPHLDSANRGPTRPGTSVVRIVHGADAGRLGQPVDLQDRNSEHAEIVLGLRRERRRSADQGL